MPRIVDRQGKKETLIRAAAAVFAKTGFANTTIAEIAAAAEVGKGTVYEYFDSKEELFFAVHTWTNARISERVNASLDPALGAAGQLDALAEASASVIRDSRDQYALNLDFWAASRGTSFEGQFKTEIAKLYREYRVLVATVLRRGRDSGEFVPHFDPDHLAGVIVGAYDGLGIQYWIDGSFDLLASARALTSVLIDGLKNRES